jgi:hypothetical protein
VKTTDDIKNKDLKIQLLADKIMSLLPLVDGIMESMDNEDFELLEEARECLEAKINYGNSASIVIIALGGNYDDTEDKMKVRTLDCLVELIKARKEYREALLKKRERQKNRQEAINMFKAMGMF